MTTTTTSSPRVQTTATFSMIGAAGRRFRVGQWHAQAGGAPLVMLNGIGMNSELLEPVAQNLPDRHVISIDMPGTGQSPDPIFPYTIAQMALTLAALIDALNIGQVDLLGISWGGALAQQFAFAHRARVRKLVLASTTPGAMMVPAHPAIIGHLFDPSEYAVERALRRNLAAVYNGGGSGQVSLNAATAASPLGWAYQLAAFAGWNGAALLPLLSLPVMIMADTEDQFIPVGNAQMMHAAIPGSQLHLSDGGGHLFMLMRPEPFCAALQAFLD